MTDREAFNYFCWRIIELAGSRKTGAISALCKRVSFTPPGDRPPWDDIKAEVIHKLSYND